MTLHTSDAVPGFVESATLFAQQAKAAGVTVNVKKEAANAFFDTSLLYTKLDFSQDFWAAGSLGAWYELALLSDAAWNETHWRQESYDKLIREAQGASGREDGRGQVPRAAADPVRRGRLHHLDEHQHRRRHGQLREGHRAELVHRARRLELPERLARQVRSTHRRAPGGLHAGRARALAALPRVPGHCVLGDD